MPLPKPKPDETKSEWDGRCMADPAMNDEYPDSDQRYAVCQSQWEEKKMSASTSQEWLRAPVRGPTIEVDRDASVIRGYVVAQEGPFTTEGRGEFDKKALREIVRLMKQEPNGLKIRFTHPTESDDGLGKFLGRAKNPRMDTLDEKAIVRADLHLNPTALKEPPGGGRPLGDYIMELAETDPAAFASSLVVQLEKEYRTDKYGRPLMDEHGEELPPLCWPIKLHASDIVDQGEAVDAFLAVDEIDGIPGSIVHRGVELLDRQFKGKPREFVETRCTAWLCRYLDHRYGQEEPTIELPEPGQPWEGEGRRWQRLQIAPALLVSMCIGDLPRGFNLENALPEDTQLVSAAYDPDTHNFELTVMSEEFAPLAEGAGTPLAVLPTFWKYWTQQDLEMATRREEREKEVGDLRRRMKWREKRRQSG